MHVQSDALVTDQCITAGWHRLEQHYPSPASLPRNEAPEIVIEDCMLQTMLRLKGPSLAILGIRYFNVAIPPKQQPMTCNGLARSKEREGRRLQLQLCIDSWAIITIVSAQHCIEKSSSMQALRSTT